MTEGKTPVTGTREVKRHGLSSFFELEPSTAFPTDESCFLFPIMPVDSLDCLGCPGVSLPLNNEEGMCSMHNCSRNCEGAFNAMPSKKKRCLSSHCHTKRSPLSTDTSLAHYSLPAKVFAAFFLSCKLYKTIRASELPLDGSEPPRVQIQSTMGAVPLKGLIFIERGEIWPTAVRSLLRSMRLICNGGESFKLEFLAGMRAASQRVEALRMCWALHYSSSCSLYDVEDPLPGENVLPVSCGILTANRFDLAVSIALQPESVKCQRHTYEAATTGITVSWHPTAMLDMVPILSDVTPS
ncbi:unnamed protein product [Leuciscus chuanchicus]